MPDSFNPARAASGLSMLARPLVAISPHLDDAVFSCGCLLSRYRESTVVTVYTGVPPDARTLTQWDRACGFADAGEAMRRRAAENREALAALGCRGLSLGLLDSQYADCPDASMPGLAESLLRTLNDLAPASMLIPLGLVHGDHIRASDAALLIWETWPDVAWYAYEDVPYRARAGAVQQRLVQLHGRGLVLTPAAFDADPQAKASAVAAYPSQIGGFNGVPEDLRRPERYWRVAGSEEPA